MLLLNRREVESLLDLDRLTEALGPAMAELSAGRVSMPARIATLVRERRGLLAAMPVYLGSTRTLSTKLVSVFPENEARGVPSHQGVILVFDAETGSPRALMDGTFITAARTAAGSALSARLLARQDARVLLIIGTGVQARAHATAIPRVRPIREIRVVGRNPQKAARLAAKITQEQGIQAFACEAVEQTFAGAHIICAATHSAQPVVKGAWLQPGTHVTSVGLNPEGCEVDAEAVRKSLVVVEMRAAALASGPGGSNDLKWPIRDGLIGEDHIHAEVGELISGAKPGRTSAEQITLYKSVGVAVQDAVAAHLVLEAAEKQGAGREVEI
ncbi:MAG: ornithine cyclodeaminase family protein [Terriglobia bacterium]|jgi:ornithine cyclodeaminase